MTHLPDLSHVHISRVGMEDAEVFLSLIDALADYEHLARPDADARRRLIADCLGEHPRFEAFLARIEDVPVGYAITFQTYSSFLALPTQYLEDLFILPDHRKQKAGLALFLHIADLAKERDCGRMEWTVLDWNTPAQECYDALGATHLKDWFPYRLTAKDLATLPQRK